MAIKWRKRKGLDPKVILGKLEACKQPEGDKYSFPAFEKIEYEAAISSMLDFDYGVSSECKSILVSKTIFHCARSAFTEQQFIDRINDEYRSILATPKRDYLVVTSMSYFPPFCLPKVEIDGCKIE